MNVNNENFLQRCRTLIGVFLGVLVCTGRSPACQRPAAWGERRVTLGKVQPRGYGDTAQVHVHGGEPQRDDPACCSPSCSALQPGRSRVLLASPRHPAIIAHRLSVLFLLLYEAPATSFEQFSHRCWLFIAWVPVPRCVQRISLTEVRATPLGKAVSLHRGTKVFLWAYKPSLCVTSLLRPTLERMSAELNKGGDSGVLVPRIRKVGWILWGAKQHTLLTWLLFLFFFSSLHRTLLMIAVFCCCYFAHTWILTSGAVWSIKSRV